MISLNFIYREQISVSIEAENARIEAEVDAAMRAADKIIDRPVPCACETEPTTPPTLN